ncbi:MAG: hypothetical protein IOC82_00505 [Aestuariivirga sp.]|uniref:hypothetical protein n=1 Tax=Aestuariivirga sp. TaxID=2650926 RepID=UPI0025C0C061|nr:hypothetical protein [Aestuariivirga sp.]MCA3559494.1 hypothetical protein [Aestuariivirga sp.]
MNWTLTTVAIAGTKVRFHAAVLIFIAWIGIADYLAGGPSAAAESIAFNLPVFLCLTLREFGRIFMVKRFGANAADAILSPIGGVAAMARMPEKPRQELPVPIARPLANVAAGFLLMLTLRPRPVPRHHHRFGPRGHGRPPADRERRAGRLQLDSCLSGGRQTRVARRAGDERSDVISIYLGRSWRHGAC